ncbi:MAG: hypothetical protein ACM3ML_13325 [Micromonosporaceae bacterium]
MRGRILVGVGAWMAGAIIATGFSNLAVMLLGRGMASDSNELLSDQAVRKALAEASASPSGSQGTWQPEASSASRNIVLTPGGGTVVAHCYRRTAYLRSWTPLEGFLAESIHRGPARTAQVAFESASQTVTLRVSCVNGAPRVKIVNLPRGTWSRGEPGDS